MLTYYLLHAFFEKKNLYLLDILYTWNTVLRNYLQTTLYNEFVMSCVKKVLLPIIRGNERLGCCLHKVDYVPLLDLISSHIFRLRTGSLTCKTSFSNSIMPLYFFAIEVHSCPFPFLTSGYLIP